MKITEKKISQNYPQNPPMAFECTIYTIFIWFRDGHIFPNKTIPKIQICLEQNNPQNPDLSNKTNLDFVDCFGLTRPIWTQSQKSRSVLFDQNNPKNPDVLLDQNYPKNPDVLLDRSGFLGLFWKRKPTL